MGLSGKLKEQFIQCVSDDTLTTEIIHELTSAIDVATIEIAMVLTCAEDAKSQRSEVAILENHKDCKNAAT